MSSRIVRRSGALAALLVAVGLPAAQGETAPVNDEITGAIEVTTTPDGYAQDPRGATASATDPMDCQVSPDPTLWYGVTAPATGVMTLKSRAGVDFDGPQSIDTNMAVYSGSPDDLTFITCGTYTPDPDRGFWEQADIDVTAGEHFYVMAAIPPLPDGITNPDGSPYSGAMTHRLTVRMRPQVSVTIVSGTASKAGVATIKGAARCSFPSTVSIGASVSQDRRRSTATGTGSVSARPCDADGEAWEIAVSSTNGIKFTQGLATVTADVFASGDVQASTTREVRLKNAR